MNEFDAIIELEYLGASPNERIHFTNELFFNKRLADFQGNPNVTRIKIYHHLKTLTQNIRWIEFP